MSRLMRGGIILAGILSTNCSLSYAGTLRQAQIDDLEFAKKNYVMKSKAFSPSDRDKALTFIDRLESGPGRSRTKSSFWPSCRLQRLRAMVTTLLMTPTAGCLQLVCRCE